MIVALMIILGVTMILGAFLAIQLKNLVAAAVSLGVVGLLTAVLYLILAAPDVAMTQAAIGSGLDLVIFLYAIHKTRNSEVEDD